MAANDTTRICKLCGIPFVGSPHAWYCSTCKEKREKEQREKELQQRKNKLKKHSCCICGKEFSTYCNSTTCSKECARILRSKKLSGHKCSTTVKTKIAAQNAINWHIVNPEGKHYKFHNLNQWVREHCELFGFEYNEKNVAKIVSGISQVKGSLLGNIKINISSYKGWTVIIEYSYEDIVSMYIAGKSVNNIHKTTGVSTNKIRKILITEGLWENAQSKKINVLLDSGMSLEEISKSIGISNKIINNYLPYTKGEYLSNKPSLNAINIRKWREKQNLQENIYERMEI